MKEETHCKSCAPIAPGGVPCAHLAELHAAAQSINDIIIQVRAAQAAALIAGIHVELDLLQHPARSPIPGTPPAPAATTPARSPSAPSTLGSQPRQQWRSQPASSCEIPQIALRVTDFDPDHGHHRRRAERAYRLPAHLVRTRAGPALPPARAWKLKLPLRPWKRPTPKRCRHPRRPGSLHASKLVAASTSRAVGPAALQRRDSPLTASRSRARTSPQERTEPDSERPKKLTPADTHVAHWVGQFHPRRLIRSSDGLGWPARSGEKAHRCSIRAPLPLTQQQALRLL